jgi:hypothetical protein
LHIRCVDRTAANFLRSFHPRNRGTDYRSHFGHDKFSFRRVV